MIVTNAHFHLITTLFPKKHDLFLYTYIHIYAYLFFIFVSDTPAKEKGDKKTIKSF